MKNGHPAFDEDCRDRVYHCPEKDNHTSCPDSVPRQVLSLKGLLKKPFYGEVFM